MKRFKSDNKKKLAFSLGTLRALIKIALWTVKTLYLSNHGCGILSF